MENNLTPRGLGVQIGAVSNSNQPVKSMSETDKEISTLYDRIESLNNHIIQLANRLKPVMREVDQGTGMVSQKEDIPTNTVMGQRIRDNRKRVELAIDAICHIESVLEV